jgi:hypothetical protein
MIFACHETRPQSTKTYSILTFTATFAKNPSNGA